MNSVGQNLVEANHLTNQHLRAAAAGIPVLATDVCGISGVKGVHTVQAGDSRPLRDKIVKILAKKYPPTKQLNSVVISQSNSIEAFH